MKSEAQEKPRVESHLSGVPETMLIPLWAKACETERDESIIKDYAAAQIVSKIDYDFKKFEKARMSQLGTCVRTLILDNAVHRFLKRCPGGVVINIGAGLDTRGERLRSEDYSRWYDLDVPEAIELRRKFFPENERRKLIGKSMFDASWTDEVQDEGRRVVIIAEGLFMYFSEEELRPLLQLLARRFPGAELLVEIMPPFVVKNTKRHDSLSTLDHAPQFKWGSRDSRDVEGWAPGVRFVEDWNYFNFCKKRWGIFGVAGRLFLRRVLNCRIARFQLEEKAS